jgi:hydrogenase maturation protease
MGAVVVTRDPPTLVVGLGNPILGDDGVGWRVVDEVERRLAAMPDPPPVVLDRLAVGGLTLMERLVGASRAILVDSIVSRDGVPGGVRVDSLGALASRPAAHLDSGHDAPLASALAAGRALGAVLPDEVIVVTVDVLPCDTFAHGLTLPVAEAVAPAADAVMEVLADTLALAETWR